MNEAQEAFCAYLKRLRADRHLSLRQVEIRTDNAVSNGYLSQLESGKVKSPSVIMLHRLAVAYEVDFEDMCRRALISAPPMPRVCPTCHQELP